MKLIKNSLFALMIVGASTSFAGNGDVESAATGSHTIQVVGPDFYKVIAKGHDEKLNFHLFWTENSDANALQISLGGDDERGYNMSLNRNQHFILGKRLSKQQYSEIATSIESATASCPTEFLLSKTLDVLSTKNLCAPKKGPMTLRVTSLDDDGKMPVLTALDEKRGLQIVLYQNSSGENRIAVESKDAINDKIYELGPSGAVTDYVISAEEYSEVSAVLNMTSAECPTEITLSKGLKVTKVKNSCQQ